MGACAQQDEKPLVPPAQAHLEGQAAVAVLAPDAMVVVVSVSEPPASAAVAPLPPPPMATIAAAARETESAPCLTRLAPPEARVAAVPSERHRAPERTFLAAGGGWRGQHHQYQYHGALRAVAVPPERALATGPAG